MPKIETDSGEPARPRPRFDEGDSDPDIAKGSAGREETHWPQGGHDMPHHSRLVVYF
jgi:hypothetical protein